MKFKVDSGLELVASEWGNINDPLVVLMHGGGQTRHAWGSTGETLSESGFYVLSLDLRGHGDSQWHPDGDYLIESYKSDLISILNQVGKPASLVGASLGGMVSLSLASDLSKKDLVTSLVMVDIGLYPNEEGSNEIVSFMQSGIKGFANLNEASDAVSASQNYSHELAKASSQLEQLNANYQKQIQDAEGNSEFNDKVNQNAEQLRAQMASLSDNLAALNNVYGGMLNAMNKK